jgi:hypothetical protein
MSATPPDDRVEIVLLSAPGTPRIERMRALLAAIDAHAGALGPAWIEEKKQRAPYSADAVLRWTSAPPNPAWGSSLTCAREDPAVSFCFALLLPGRSADLSLDVMIPMAWCGRSAERGDAIAGLVRAMAEAMHASFGFAHSERDLSLGRDAHVTDPYAPLEVVESHWVDVYGAPLVEKLGRARVMSTPGDVRANPDGGVVLATGQTPADGLSDGSRHTQARALAHLTGEPFESILARLTERSARLAPVERRFDPDLAELLNAVVDGLSCGEQSAAIATWNAFRPPEPDEWLPAGRAPASDVPDPGREVARYGSQLSERLVALLHPYVKGIRAADPRLLPRVDAHFWAFDYPRGYPRATIDEDLVPALGAWLGEVLVKSLGGRWVPRRSIEESQVVVGDRAWLPFRRARRYLASRDAVASYSLSQFHRWAERGRGVDVPRAT